MTCSTGTVTSGSEFHSHLRRHSRHSVAIKRCDCIAVTAGALFENSDSPDRFPGHAVRRAEHDDYHHRVLHRPNPGRLNRNGGDP